MNPRGISLIAHADWSVNSRKRWCAWAIRESDGRYRAYLPERVIQPRSLLLRLQEIVGPSGCILAGFDFPMGIPHHYAEKAGITDFLAWMSTLGTGEWKDFFKVAETREQISLHRPFYPSRPGKSFRHDLTDRLGIEPFQELLRVCERAHPGRRAACPMFWTLGGQQVGKAALSGWQDVLLPALRQQEHIGGDPDSRPGAGKRFAIWPFSGPLESLLRPGTTVVVETYPAEFYRRLGVHFSPSLPGCRSGKRDQADRTAQADPLLDWATQSDLAIDEKLERAIQDGFGASSGGEDRFDAVVGLFGMLDVLSQHARFVEPEEERIRMVEGWIFGQDPGMDTVI